MNMENPHTTDNDSLIPESQWSLSGTSNKIVNKIWNNN